LDEEYLVGDFEDSDLCLKVRRSGYDIGCLQQNGLIHLERQSFSSIGAEMFRDRVARYNAWRHQMKWGSYISELLNRDRVNQ
jgi:O-antigen biosynthesis protein